ncbi:MAG: isopentenyl-diphosphate Delta-isomerase [Candidatus Saccharimonadales bacterium]
MEYIVFVDEQGNPTGETGEKLASHTGITKLHLGFSCYIFNEDGKVLVTRRANSKKVWPSVWTNSVCGHPGPGESFDDAIRRRAMYELGIEVTDVEVKLPNFRYTTPPYNGIIENEFCPVFYARASAEPNPNPEEVSAYKWLTWREFVNESTNDQHDVWSWWCKDQVKQLKAPK